MFLPELVQKSCYFCQVYYRLDNDRSGFCYSNLMPEIIRQRILLANGIAQRYDKQAILMLLAVDKSNLVIIRIDAIFNIAKIVPDRTAAQEVAKPNGNENNGDIDIGLFHYFSNSMFIWRSVIVLLALAALQVTVTVTAWVVVVSIVAVAVLGTQTVAVANAAVANLPDA